MIADDTNLEHRVMRELSDLAAQCGAVVLVVDFTDVPLQTCIDRDAARPIGERVGADRIRAMWARHLAEQG